MLLQTAFKREIFRAAQLWRVDDHLPLIADVDSYVGAEEIQAIVFSATGLAGGSHSLTIQVAGLKNAASTDSLIVVDAFDVGPRGKPIAGLDRPLADYSAY